MNTELNPKLFENDKLKPDIRERLLEIVDEFLSFVDDKLAFDILDVRIVGSNAGYNYTDTSDIDLHIVVNLAEICKETPELVQFLFNAEKARFNLLYDVSIKKTDVEVYVEDVKAGTHSNGIYSVLYDKWVRFPQEDTNDYEKIYQEVKSSEDYINLVNEINQVLSNGDSTDIKEELNKVYLIRKEALDSEGELGLGNIMFKLLRSEGYLDKLRGDYYETRSKELTIENFYYKNHKYQ